MSTDDLAKHQCFHLHQKITMMVNRYHVYTDSGGEPGQLIAFVEQKRMKFKEEVTLYADESKETVVGRFKARKVVDLASAYDVTGDDDRPVGVFGKRFAKSLLRSTWQLDQPGQDPVTISERSGALAFFRRIWEAVPYAGDWPFPWKYHFDFVRGGHTVATFEKKTRFRDHYLIGIDDDTLDRTLVLAQTVALDALQSR